MNDAFSKAIDIVKQISSCRVTWLAKALPPMAQSVGAILTALTASLIPFIFTDNVILGTILLLFLISLYSWLLFLAFKKTFKYTFGMANLAGVKVEELSSTDLILFPLVMLLVVLVSQYLHYPQLLMSSPFIALGVLKILSKRKEGSVSGTVLISLSMLSSAARLEALPAALASSYAVASIIESLMDLEEAEKCVSIRRLEKAQGTDRL